MQTNEYEMMRAVQDRHWWWLGRRALLQRLMEKYIGAGHPGYRVADVGSGYGANISLLSAYGQVYALELDDECLTHIAATKPEAIRVKWRSPQPVDMKFDAVLLADVLEHIDDDHAAMRWIENHLKPGGYAFITVPAHMHLWSEMDEVVHHFRRYSKPALLGTVDSGLTIERLSFYNATLYPVKVAFVIITKFLRLSAPAKPKKSYNDLPPRAINTVFRLIMAAEAWLIRYISLPFGVSFVMILKKS